MFREFVAMSNREPSDWPDGREPTVEIAVQPRTLPAEPTYREQLLVVLGEGPGRAFPIESAVTIGRGAECEVMLPDASVSRRHARVTRNPDGRLHIQDLASRNGTAVNGIPVTSRVLTIGDRIQLGSRVVLLLTHDDPVKEIFRERQKMEAMGRLAAGVAHDFNNICSIAIAMTDELGEELGPRGLLEAGPIADCLRDLRGALQRGTDLTRSLASFGRKEPTTPAGIVDLAEVCEDVARLCQRTFGPNIEVRRRWTTGLSLRAHRTELHQILMNLCLNARDAMPKGGTLRISAEHGSGVRGAGRGHSDWILLRVADTGTGMDKKTQSRIFDAFFTTKAEGRGTGLGLATVRDLVQQMGGRIELESSPGHGSVFLVWLPAASEAA